MREPQTHSSTFTHTPHLKASVLLPSDSFESLNTSCVARVEVHAHSTSDENTNRHQLKCINIHTILDSEYLSIHYPLPSLKHATLFRKELKHRSAAERREPQLTSVSCPRDYIHQKAGRGAEPHSLSPCLHQCSCHSTPAAIPVQVNAVHAAGGTSILLHLPAVHGILVEEAHCVNRAGKTVHQQSRRRHFTLGSSCGQWKRSTESSSPCCALTQGPAASAGSSCWPSPLPAWELAHG